MNTPEGDKMNAEEWFKKGLAFSEEGKSQEALEAFDKVIEIDPEHAEAWFWKGVALDRLGRHEEAREAYDKAREAYDKALEIDRQDAEAWNGKGAALDRLGRHEEALDAFSRALKMRPHYPKAWYNQGVALGELGRHEEAVEAYEKAIEIDPQYAKAWYNKGVALGELGRHEKAVEAFEKAIEIDPQDAWAYSAWGEILLDTGCVEGAAEKVNEALDRGPELTWALILDGRIKLEKKDYDHAIESFKEAISSDLGNPLPLLWDAYAEYLKIEPLPEQTSKECQEELTTIVRKLERANDLAEKRKDQRVRPYVLYYLGYFYCQKKDFYRAKEKLEECLKSKPESPIRSAVTTLVNDIWNYKIRPPLWQWWLLSPVHGWWKRILFFFLTISLCSLLLLHPLIEGWLVYFNMQANWTLYIILVGLLIVLLALPTLESIKAKEIEVELASPPSFEPVLSPLAMEMALRELEGE